MVAKIHKSKKLVSRAAPILMVGTGNGDDAAIIF